MRTAKITPDKTLTPVVIEFEKPREFDRIDVRRIDKVGTSICRAVGVIQKEDGDFLRLIHSVEGINDNREGRPEMTGITIPKDAIINTGRPFDISLVDYLDHVSFHYYITQDINKCIPWQCTVYGRVQEDNDQFVRLIWLEETTFPEEETRQDGIIVLKSTIISQETFKAENGEK